MQQQLSITLMYTVHGATPKSNLNLLEALQKHAIRLINKPELTNSLPTLSDRFKIEDLFQFYSYSIVTVPKKFLISSHRLKFLLICKSSPNLS